MSIEGGTVDDVGNGVENGSGCCVWWVWWSDGDGGFVDESWYWRTGWDLMCLCESDECDGVWEVGNSVWMAVIVRSVGFVFEVPRVERCLVDVVFTNVLQRLALLLEMMVGFMWLLADWAIVAGGKAGCFEHVAGSKGIGEDGGKVIMELVGWLRIVGWERSSDIFQNWAARFSVKEGGSVRVDVGVGWEIDVFPLRRIGGIMDGEGEFDIVLEKVVW